MLAALLEAALASLYLEHGFETVAAAIVEAFAERIDYALTHRVDYKTELQEELARRGRSVNYSLLDCEGPPHERVFTAAAVIDGSRAGVGRGSSKKGAEQEAAREALAGLGAGPEPPADRHPETASRGGPLSAAIGRLCGRVYLKTIKLRGFKSFVDPVEVRFEPGELQAV